MQADVAGVEACAAQVEVADAATIDGEGYFAGAADVANIGGDIDDVSSYVARVAAWVGNIYGWRHWLIVNNYGLFAGLAYAVVCAYFDSIAACVEADVVGGEVCAAEREVIDALAIDQECDVVGRGYISNGSVDIFAVVAGVERVGIWRSNIYGWRRSGLFVNDYSLVAGCAVWVCTCDNNIVVALLECDIVGCEAVA